MAEEEEGEGEGEGEGTAVPMQPPAAHAPGAAALAGEMLDEE